MRKREPVALLYCLLDFLFLWMFLTVPCVGMQCVIVIFPDHTHLFLELEPTYIFLTKSSSQIVLLPLYS